VGIDPLLANQVGGDEQISNDKLQGMADQLSQRLADNPNNAEGWVMMGRIERALGGFDKADTAFKKALSLRPIDDVRIERAEVLAQKNQGKFDGEPWDIIHSVLKADPSMAMPCCWQAVPRFRKVSFKTPWAIGTKCVACRPPPRPTYRLWWKPSTKPVSV
jgi:cytochrome c-type biogenesis protein CcmH